MNVYLCLLVLAAGLTSLHGLGLLDEYSCIHDEIAERNPYVINAAAQGEPGRTKRQISTNYSSIRITPFLTDIDPEFASYVNETDALSRAIEILESVLMVDAESVDDNFILPPFCNEFTTGINKGKCEDPLPENISYTCGEFGVVPDEFISNREVCYSQNGSCYLDGANGTGIPNTDYLLFVSAVNTSTCAANRIIGYSSSCILDGSKNHRPIVGYINICPPMILGTQFKDETIVSILTHEIIHTLGFSVFLSDRFVDESGNNYNATMDVVGPYGPTTTFRGSKTVEFARSYYSCDSIEGVSFENEQANSSHWERRTLNHELMNGVITDDYQVLSEFTLALFEDTGWYKANYSALYDLNQQKLHWGKGLGCSFLTEQCTNSSVYPYLCDININPVMCTPDHLSKGLCSTSWTFMDGCAVALLINSESFCRLELSTKPNNGIESFGNNSICVDALQSMNYTCGIYLTKPAEPFCVSQETYNTNNSLSYILNVNGLSYNCSDNHAIITDINWTLLCPPAEEVALQASLIIDDELPALSPFEYIVINDLSKLGIVEFIKPDNRTCLPEFYPFGLSENDQILNNTVDDATSGLINLTNHVYFYGKAIRRTYVADNGIISFENLFNRHIPHPLPLYNITFVAPYWADVDLTGTGQVFYRQTNDTAIVARSTREIQSAFPFSQDTNITNVFIVTWYGVGYYRKQTDRINTFQCVIATSKIESFIIFIYVHGGIQWTTGQSSLEIEALAGINAGDGVNSATIPGSLTPDIINIAQTTNVGIPGVWMFKVGEAIRVNFLSRYVSAVEPSRHVPIRIVSSGGTSNIPITVIVTPSEQSPTSAMGSNVDFDSNTFNLTFIPNQMVDEIFNISIVCDNLKDGNEYFDVTITTDSPLAHIDNNVASVRINDLIVNFNQSLVTVPEDADTVSLELTVYPTTYEQFEVGISLMDIDAMSGEDYNGTDIFVNFLVSMSSKSFRIDIFDDGIIEGNEAFTVQIVSVSACGISIGNFDTVQVSIIDNEGTLTSQFTHVGGNVSFTCINDVSFDYAWYYNNFTVVDDPGHITGANTSTLVITNVSATEWGAYQCIATHNNFSSIVEGTLHVSPEGTVVTSEEIIITFNNSSVSVTCSAEGGPNNLYQWREQGELISYNSELHFQSITGSDGGVYQCIVVNEAGYGTALTYLYVAPYNVMISEATVNDAIIYTCYSDGGPNNQYHWMRQGGEHFTISQHLVFTMKVQLNEGTYECTVINDAGRKTVSITFSDSPVIRRLPAMQTVTLESGFVISCNAAGNPPPQISWRKNGVAYASSERVNITMQSFSGFAVSSLTVSSAIQSDGGLYECVAVNVLGIDSDNITVLIAGQECIGLTSNVEGSKITNCTSGITQFGYQGDTCVVIYNNTIGQVKELWSCQENGEWISTSVLVLHSETNSTQVANITDTVNFICNISGFPLSSIQIGWAFPVHTRDDRIDINTVTNNNYVVSILTIKLIQPSDAGLYRCTPSLEGIAGNILFKLIVANSTECRPDIDEEWGIQWQLTNAGSVAVGQCHSGSGLAYRVCLPNATWDMVINDTECKSDMLQMLFGLLSDINNNSSDLINNIDEVEAISKGISDFTNVTTGISPDELSTANDIISVLANVTRSVLEQNLTSEAANNLQSIVQSTSNTIDNMLSISNAKSFEESQNLTTAEDLFQNIENWAVVVGDVFDATADVSNRSISITPPQGNIVFNAQRISENPLRNIVFPEYCGDQSSIPQDKICDVYITIPSNAIIYQRNIEGENVPVVNFIARNLQSYLNNHTTSELYDNTSNVIISSQISRGFIQLPENGTVQMTFYVGNISHPITANCVFWNFSLNSNRGGWSSEGIIQDDNPNRKVSCGSTHLTSFSVLVSARATSDHKVLHVVSYIGCGISIFCLLLTIAAMIILRKTTFKAKHNKIHLNFSIALLLGLTVFVSGIETAKDDRVGCILVASLLHYFFLAVFCWALCEGVIIYILFAKPFYKGVFQKLLFFLLLGWGTPIPIVAISVALSHENYAIKDDSGNRITCWISDEEGAIWAFTAPMIVMLLINCALLTASLWNIYQAKKKHSAMTEAQKSNYQVVKLLIMSVIALLPLLCGTWILGLLFLVDSESEVLAWIFTIINSLQGFLVFIFYVVRNKEVSKEIAEKVTMWKKQRLIRSSTRVSSQQKHSQKDASKTSRFGSSFTDKNSTSNPINRLSILTARDSSLMDEELAVLAKSDYSQSETL